ncbi:MAG TPA: patatin-like phospholipase family protein [Candidatus Limnocylindrales bacterium]|nr:patatin-like phospholipase family protein [Candidatus Limnocylindrales bacterium]
MGKADLKIGVALGGGGAAGIACVGVLEELLAAGIRFHCVAGTSAGAVVGAALAAGRIDEFARIMTSLTRGRVMSLFDAVWPRSGLLAGRRGIELIQPVIGRRIEYLPMKFAAVATDLDTGDEVILEAGPVDEAIRASVAIPGIFRPHIIEGRVLVDGGLSNPVPVSVARRLGADFVIAISMLRPSGVVEITATTSDAATPLDPHEPLAEDEDTQALHRLGEEHLGIVQILTKGSVIVQSHIAAARFRDDPPDVFISPRATHIGIFELMRSGEAVEAGREMGKRALPAVLQAIEKERARRSRLSYRLRRAMGLQSKRVVTRRA